MRIELVKQLVVNETYHINFNAGVVDSKIFQSLLYGCCNEVTFLNADHQPRIHPARGILHCFLENTVGLLDLWIIVKKGNSGTGKVHATLVANKKRSMEFLFQV